MYTQLPDEYFDDRDDLPQKWTSREDRIEKSDKARDKRARLKARKAKQWERALN